jgi:hypothetical protein
MLWLRPLACAFGGRRFFGFLGALRHTADFDRLCSLDFDATPSFAWCQARDKGALLPHPAGPCAFAGSRW